MGSDIGRPLDIDLLEKEQQPWAASAIANVILAVLVVAALALLVTTLALWNSMRADVAALNDRLVAAQAVVSQAATPLPEVVALQQDLDATRRQNARLEADLLTLSGRKVTWGTALNAVFTQAGPDVTVSSVRTEGRLVTVTGDAANLDVITAFTDRLRATGYFINVVIQMAATQGTPLPTPTFPPLLPTMTPGPAAPTATMLPYPLTPTPSYPLVPTPSWTPVPTWTAMPTWTPQPTYTPLPTYTQPPPTPMPPPPTLVAVRLRNISFSPPSLAPGGVLRVEMTVENIGNVTLFSEDQPPPGYTYNEGQVSPPGIAGRWRVGIDVQANALANMHRYRWGLGGPLVPGSSRVVIGYVRLVTPGVYTYCAGIVQEFVRWYANCAGAATITVTSPSTPTPTATPTIAALPSPTRSPTACADGYEPDNTWQEARVIGANTSLAQVHTFHVFGDTDWVKFAVMPNVTYTLRTFNLTNGADTMITLYGNEGGVLHQLAQNDEDPGNATAIPPRAGPSRIDFRPTTTDTTRFGTTFYARLNSPNPSNFGCTKSYNLSLTSGPSSQRFGGAQLVRMSVDETRPAPAIGSAPNEALPAMERDVEHRQALASAPAQRVSFIIVLELRGGGP